MNSDRHPFLSPAWQAARRHEIQVARMRGFRRQSRRSPLPAFLTLAVLVGISAWWWPFTTRPTGMRPVVQTSSVIAVSSQ